MRFLIIGGTGYIGSALYDCLSVNFEVTTVDLEWFGNYVNANNIKKDYKELSEEFLSKYDVIIMLAGHSSVQMCEDNFLSTMSNNVFNFINLIKKLNNQKFIYASSSSIYSEKFNADENEGNYSPNNPYDISKKLIDDIISISNINYYGLRFGTVNGPSKNFRNELMLNKMFVDAKEKNIIEITNPELKRPILGISDLCRAIETISTNKLERPGIYNVASFNSTVKEMSGIVADKTGAKVIEKNAKKGYDFSINSDKIIKTFNFNFTSTIESILNELNEFKYYGKLPRVEKIKYV